MRTLAALVVMASPNMIGISSVLPGILGSMETGKYLVHKELRESPV